MEEKTRDGVARLCTRIGAAMEDRSAELLFARSMSDAEIAAMLERVECALTEMQMTANHLRKLVVKRNDGLVGHSGTAA